jgi:hypothetical protein
MGHIDWVKLFQRAAIVLCAGVVVFTGYISCHNIRQSSYKKNQVLEIKCQFEKAKNLSDSYEVQGHYDDCLLIMSEQYNKICNSDLIGIFEIKCKAAEEICRLKKTMKNKLESGFVDFEGMIITPQQATNIIKEREEKAKNPVVVEETVEKKWKWEYGGFNYNWYNSYRDWKRTKDNSLICYIFLGLLGGIVFTIELIVNIILAIVFFVFFVILLEWLVWLIIVAILITIGGFIFGKASGLR